MHNNLQTYPTAANSSVRCRRCRINSMEKINYRCRCAFYYLSPPSPVTAAARARTAAYPKTDDKCFFVRDSERGRKRERERERQLSHNRACNTCYRRDGRRMKFTAEKRKTRGEKEETARPRARARDRSSLDCGRV